MKNTPAIKQLVYTSMSHRGALQQTIEELMLFSQTSSNKNNISGCIFFHHREFVHIMEGDPTAIDSIYERITNDDRHKHVTIVFEDIVDRRHFDCTYIASDLSLFSTVDSNLQVISLQAASDLIKPLKHSSTAVKLFANIVDQLLEEAVQ